jgi:hypothetical protein
MYEQIATSATQILANLFLIFIASIIAGAIWAKIAGKA